MSQIDERVLPEAEEGPGEVNDVKLVPVGESIRYRRRAQGAEKRVEELAGELAEARAEATRLADELKVTQKEQELMRRLVSEGTRDLETAVLIAKARLAKDEKADLAGIVEQLKKEKQYLFGGKTSGNATVRTSPVKEQKNGAGSLERAAKRAAGRQTPVKSRSGQRQKQDKRRDPFVK